MHILVSNDDGCHARGIRTLAARLRDLADVTVVAPDRNRSGASNSLTLDSPLRVHRHDDGVYCVSGTPTDCVHLAISGLLPEPPDMVLSGINHGPNLGDDTLYSGTVAAAVEGRSLGLPTMAISLAGYDNGHFEGAAEVSAQLVQRLLAHPLPRDTILNVNVPDQPFESLRGFKSTRLGARHPSEPVIPERDPRGLPIYWIGPAGSEQDAGEGTDFHAIAAGYVSVTPLEIDLTRHEAVSKLGSWLERT